MRAIVTLLLVAIHARLALALPVVETEPSWGSEPTRRGTMGILLPCLITLGLCVWTAVHLNINPQPTPGRLLLFKLAWLLLGMLAPEFVLWCAYDQFMEARAIRNVILKIQTHRLNFAKLRGTKNQDERIEGFDMKAAFFVLMGGYAVHPGPEKVYGLPVTLTAQGFTLLYAQDEINVTEDLEPRLIEDKSKADGLAKVVVCIQALWLVVEGAGRLTSGLPLTLLELHTIMHVLCAVAIYAFWWHKPMDIRYPVLLHLEPSLAARIYRSFDGSRNYGAPDFEIPISGPHTEDAVADVLVAPEVKDNVSPHSEDAELARADTKYPDRLEANRVRARMHRIRVAGGYNIFNFFGWRDSFCLWPPASGDSKARNRWQDYDIRSKGAFSLMPEDIGFHDASSRENACVRARMVLREGSVRFDDDKQGSWLVLVAFAVAYGGAHASAWNTHMPSQIELLLWRISSVAVAVGIPLGLGAYLCAEKLDRYFYTRTGPGRLVKCMKWLGGGDCVVNTVSLCFCFPLLLFVLVARGFMVSESFISLRSLEKGSFDVVPWSNYWPHF
ncbi:hypothetical protein BZA05DRAFT_355039 [Tricharina praecox]|uniref:uncharacterized protein n=1 Tax=Tricharina praecox TaxID=43433 RepID=UPI00221F8FFF|nr:uncharacterized protein BZA05DRAFT_355039 [Tricharina praecox]KAI5849903.1 hypothetical protein BZA05DRAFT_355039 [Tricharina praecox]